MTSKEFLPYLKCVGTGPKRNRDLSKEEMKIVMSAFLKKEVLPEQIAAFILGWRVKGESIDEFAAAIEVFDELVKHEPLENSVEFGYPYDGKVKNPYIFPLTASYLKEYDINFSLHGGLLQPAKNGTTIKEICESINLPSNVHYYDRQEYFPELYEFSDVREKLGLRSSFNTIEKLLNITQSDIAIIGAFHKPFVDKYIKLFKDRYKKLIIIKGNEGTPEIFSKCTMTIVENDEQIEMKVDPKDFGINYKKFIHKISLEESLKQIEDPSDEFLKLAKLNAAVILFLTNKAKSVEEAYEKL
ncbi:Anthranilate phosphoribosyltransferase like [hydrothermal vent metagenome]|uniref:Anthranilate phosphoribosyltransferase like n=1 Tax=hydrothermal vent metagenome TaxID=652676 RepID=A0A1W1EG14_9ZZZZ